MSAREVELSGGAPWGFRMHGGADHNTPLRISRVNPGRKASLSGIREGDVITSINGQQTRHMSNADAHAMLRSAGPVLRLGLNEDREMSPRRRSIGKASELKRPSQLMMDFSSEVATPQAPVYATIKTANPPKKPLPPHHGSSSGLSSIPLVKSAAFPETLKLHPTNPFLTTIPTSASKLPVPNGKLPQTSLDKSKYKSLFMNGSQPDLHSTGTNGDEPTNREGQNEMERPDGDLKSTSIPKISINDNETYHIPVNSKNPFQTHKTEDSKSTNGHMDSEKPKGGDFYSEDILKNSIITEHKISEVEEIKTVKKIILNGSSTFDGENSDQTFCGTSESRPTFNGTNKFHEIPKSASDFATNTTTETKSAQQFSNGYPKKFSPRDEPRSSFFDLSPSMHQFKDNEKRFEADTLSAKSVDVPSVSSPTTETNKQTVMITPTFKARSSSPVVWRPGAPAAPVRSESSSTPGAPPPPPPPVWSPSSAPSPQSQRKTFRPVHFEESPPPRRKASAENGCLSGSDSEGRLKTSHSAPVTGLNTLGLSTNSRLPRAQNPTVTLLQKAREGLLQQTNIIQQERDARLPRDRPSPPRGDPVYALRAEYDASEGDGRRSKMSDGHKKVDGIGPTTKDGMPVTLRSEVKDPSRWYKKMYDTIHKNKYDDDYVTIRYKNRRGETIQRPSSNRSQYAYFDPRSGYLSEPEGRRVPSAWSDYDSDATGPRRRTASVQEERRNESPYMTNKYSTLASARASQEVYKGQPGRIENYVPGRSSVIDKEAKQWWDEVMDIFDGWLDENAPLPPYTTFLARAIQKNQRNMSNSSLPQASPKEKKDITSTILSKSNMARALKESGYESDSTLIFRRREETDGPLSPAERRAAYRDLQAGGEPPLRGFRSPAPPRQEGESAPEPPRRSAYGSYSDTESPNRRYVESDVNIHYRCPVRRDPLPLVPERELARQQAEHMKSLYREQKRNKYLQDNNIDPRDIEAFDASMKELQDAQNRRHQDNFMPSQKLVIPPNRYDEAEKIVARALYTFNGQTSRELSFRKGDFISVRRQIDANWYEGEIHGRIGLFPYNYVELLKGDGSRSPRRSAVIEGRAKAKFDFTAQTNLELPLKKGEIVTLTRRIDQNWWEGRNGHKTGIFPDSYVTVLQEPSQSKPESQPILNTDKPVASPAAHGLLNGSDKRSMGTHSYTPQQNSSALANAPPATQPLPGYAVSKNQRTVTPSDRGYGPPTGAGVDLNNTEPLYVDTNAEAIPYRAMYKYRPQNPDELELSEGDTVYVLEKCDDGWYVGSSQRTGRFGTFPGNYVERI
ncbi:sorbin and SH3 domain-containing protein 1 isoform X11 [Aricia agestis]|uniref:sorbin and SH3 domain-containing protein 1 isoform X11 n=1 Tax=Aricia agestis TaxID=91739 RepID=UPI001C209B42|nr:sorbin and SH3 domain-containing protein 1 isoform X11 [Aricia agestis]